MNFIIKVLISFTFFLSTLSFADPLMIGTEAFSPPFVMQGGSATELYGFDIDMMNRLCKIMQRECQYKIMKFEDLLDAVATHKIDMAVSSITITLERSKRVHFSLPYLLSYSRFLTKKSDKIINFSTNFLNDKRIGIEKGTIFIEHLKKLGITRATIKEYSNTNALIQALNLDAVDFILLDNATALYWEANFLPRNLVTVGNVFMYGYGLGIAVNPLDDKLLHDLNNALLQYQLTDFKKNYNTYFEL